MVTINSFCTSSKLYIFKAPHSQYHKHIIFIYFQKRRTMSIDIGNTVLEKKQLYWSQNVCQAKYIGHMGKLRFSVTNYWSNWEFIQINWMLTRNIFCLTSWMMGAGRQEPEFKKLQALDSTLRNMSARAQHNLANWHSSLTKV